MRARVSGATCSISQHSICVWESSVPITVWPLVASVVGFALSLIALSALALNYDEIVSTSMFGPPRWVATIARFTHRLCDGQPGSSPSCRQVLMLLP